MTKQQLVHVGVFLTAWMIGCSLPDDSTVTAELYPPIISSTATSLKSLNVASVTVPAGKTTIDTVITVTVSVSDVNGAGDIASVSCSVVTPDGTFLKSAPLHDDGLSPDAAAHDGNYTATVAVSFPKELLGTYQLQFQTVDQSGYSSAVVSLPVRIYNTINSAPVLSNLVAPDTIFVPAAGTTELAKVSATVFDADGLADVKSVTLTIFRPVEGTVANIWQMYDDGGTVAVQPFLISSGDLVANDGIYTFTIPVPSNTQKNMERDFIITAVDQSDSVSVLLRKRVYFR